jgi:hypothetical protein
MGVDVPERFVFLCQIVQQQHFDVVFENIGVIAGMEGVAVTEHDCKSEIVHKRDCPAPAERGTMF